MASIPLSGALPQQPINPLQQAQGAMSLQGLINQSRLEQQQTQQAAQLFPAQLQQQQAATQQQQIATQQAQQQQSDTQAFNQAFKDANGDWDTAIQGAIKNGASGQFITKAQLARNDMLTKAAALTKDQLANEAAKSNELAQSAQRVIDADPDKQADVYASERNKHLQSGAYQPSDIPQQMPSIDDLKNLALHNKANQDLIKEAQAIQDEQSQQPQKKAEAAVKQTQALGQMLGNAESDVQWQGILKTAKANGTPDDVISQFADTYTPEEATRAKAMALSPEQQAGLTSAAADSKARNIMMNQQLGRPVSPEDKAYLAAYTREKELTTVARINLQNQNAATAGGLGVPGNGAASVGVGGPVATGATGVPAPVAPPSAVAPKVLAAPNPTTPASTGDSLVSPRGFTINNVPGNIRAQVQQVLDYRKADPPQSRSNPVNQAINQWVAELDPQHDTTNFAAKNKIVQQYTKDMASGSLGAINTALGHLAELKIAAKAIEQNDVPLLNGIANHLGVAVGSDAPTTYTAILHRVGPEMTSAYVKGGGGEAERGANEADFAVSKGAKQIQSNIDESAMLLNSKLAAERKNWQDTYKPYRDADQFDNRFLTPEAKEILASASKAAPTARATAGGAKIGDIVTQNGHRFKITAVDAGGKPTAADPQ